MLVCADGSTSRLATQLGYCTEAPQVGWAWGPWLWLGPIIGLGPGWMAVACGAAACSLQLLPQLQRVQQLLPAPGLQCNARLPSPRCTNTSCRVCLRGLTSTGAATMQTLMALSSTPAGPCPGMCAGAPA
jgi:hypothetical protein